MLHEMGTNRLLTFYCDMEVMSMQEMSQGKETPLHLAAQNGHQHVVQSLILHGGEVSAQTVPYIGQETKILVKKGIG